ncbi:hypothetical protein BH10PSE13_BH10PSE13_04330 [soil metagenome]
MPASASTLRPDRRLAAALGLALAVLLATPAAGATGREAGAFDEAPIADSALKGLTARENLSLVASNTQTASISGNSVNGVTTTGEAGVSGQAFQGAQGMMLVSVNSGNNVSINAALSVNIIINPQP